GGVRCVELLRVLQEVMPRLVKTVISHDNETSLRNIIAHRASSPEILEAGFSLNWPEQDTLLAFDVEIGGFPLIGTIRELAGAIPYYIMDSLRVLLGASAEDCKLRDWSDRVAFTEADFEPVWVNPFIHYSSYIDPDKNGPIVSIVRWTPGGFRPHQQHLKEEVFDLAVSPTPAEQQTP
ncbi:hypothetical protein, partial [Salidesulfovibrio brasiliensis]|uniref:hypothetical protein n=1 Tax=Salidesulfovibrio brasiliensis TaxID=221711 RepID=UPI000A6945B5